MEGFVSNQSAVKVAFACGMAVGCSVTVILGSVLYIFRQFVINKKYLFGICKHNGDNDVDEIAESPQPYFMVSQPITPYPTATVLRPYSPPATPTSRLSDESKTTLQRHSSLSRRPKESILCPAVKWANKTPDTMPVVYAHYDLPSRHGPNPLSPSECLCKSTSSSGHEEPRYFDTNQPNSTPIIPQLPFSGHQESQYYVNMDGQNVTSSTQPFSAPPTPIIIHHNDDDPLYENIHYEPIFDISGLPSPPTPPPLPPTASFPKY